MTLNEQIFNPEMLILARQSRGIGQKELAEMLIVTPGWLAKVEGGVKGLTLEKLTRIAELLDYPVEFFFSNKRIYGPGISEMFHRRRCNVPARILDKSQAQKEIRRMHLTDLLQGVELGAIEIHTYDLCEFQDNVQDIARAVRANLHLPRGPIMNVTTAIEQARGIVIPLDFETKRIDAASCWPPNMPPLFFIDTNNVWDRIRFSLCHELGHMVMHPDMPNPQMEQQANVFAAEFLMPEEDIRPYLTNISIEKLASMKPFWKISMAALLQRAKDLGEITPRHAKTLWMQMGMDGWRIREPIELDIPPEMPKLLHEIIGIYTNDMGFTFSDLAKLFRLHPHEVCHMYFGKHLHSRHEDVDEAIKEAEAILKSFRKDIR